MSMHELNKTHLQSTLRIALDELEGCVDVDHYGGLCQLKKTLQQWIARLDPSEPIPSMNVEETSRYSANLSTLEMDDIDILKL